MSEGLFPLSFSQKGLDIRITLDIPPPFQKGLEVDITETTILIRSEGKLIMRSRLYRPVIAEKSKWKVEEGSKLKILLQKKVPPNRHSLSDRVPSYSWPHYLQVPVPTDRTRLPKITNGIFGNEAEGIGSDIQSHLTRFFDLQRDFLRNQFQKKYPDVKYRLSSSPNGFITFRRTSQLASPGLLTPKQIFDNALKSEKDSEDPNVLSKAFEHFQKAADLGHLEAQLKVAGILMHQNTPFVYSREPDRETSEFYYKLAAFTHLSATAAHQLALVQLSKASGKKHAAFSYFVFASVNGSVESMRYVGMQLQGERKRYNAAKSWYLMGMRRGDSHCAYKLGELYYKQLKREPDSTETARKYFLIAHKWNESHAIPYDLVINLEEEVEKANEADPEKKSKSNILSGSGLIGEGSMSILSDVLGSQEWMTPTKTDQEAGIDSSFSFISDVSEPKKKKEEEEGDLGSSEFFTSNSLIKSSEIGVVSKEEEATDIKLLSADGKKVPDEVEVEEEKKESIEQIEKIEMEKIDSILRKLQENEEIMSQGKKKKKKKKKTKKKKKDDEDWKENVSSFVTDAIPYVATWAVIGGIGYLMWRKFR